MTLKVFNIFKFKVFKHRYIIYYVLAFFFLSLYKTPRQLEEGTSEPNDLIMVPHWAFPPSLHLRSIARWYASQIDLCKISYKLLHHTSQFSVTEIDQKAITKRIVLKLYITFLITTPLKQPNHWPYNNPVLHVNFILIVNKYCTRRALECG